MNNNSTSSANVLHVITENGEQCFRWANNQLSYIAQDRRELPAVLATKFGQLAMKLDLSYNSLSSYANINQFIKLNELILDNNSLEDRCLDFKQNLLLKTLSLNKNKLTNLTQLVKQIKLNFPNLEFLSLVGNPLYPAQVDGSNDNNCHHQKYRNFVIYQLPNLRFLDSRQVTNKERAEAFRRCAWMLSSRVEPTPTTLNETITATPPQITDESVATNRQDVAVNGRRLITESSSQQQAEQFRVSIGRPERRKGKMLGNYLQTAGVFTRVTHKYTGLNSEGNRFIRNNDL